MKIPVLLLSAVFLITLVPGAFAATYLINGQQALDITAQDSRNQTFFLVFTSVDPSNISSSGDIASWIGFGDAAATSHTFSSFSSLTALLVTVRVPNGTAEGEYKGFINANGLVISQLSVTVVPPLANITTLRNQADVNAKLDSLKTLISGVGDKVDLASAGLSTSTGNIKTAVDLLNSEKATVASLEQQNAVLESRLTELQKNATVTTTKETSTLKLELDKVTGRVVEERNFSFGAGFLVGALLIYLLMNWKSVRGLVSGKMRFRFSPQSVQSLAVALPLAVVGVYLLL